METGEEGGKEEEVPHATPYIEVSEVPVEMGMVVFIPISSQQVLVHGLDEGEQCLAEHVASILGGNKPSWDSGERCYHPRQS